VLIRCWCDIKWRCVIYWLRVDVTYLYVKRTVIHELKYVILIYKYIGWMILFVKWRCALPPYVFSSNITKRGGCIFNFSSVLSISGGNLLVSHNLNDLTTNITKVHHLFFFQTMCETWWTERRANAKSTMHVPFLAKIGPQGIGRKPLGYWLELVFSNRLNTN
jgi:hypothetical protein